MKEIAQSHGINVYQPEDVNDLKFIDKIKEINPELIIVAAYGQIFSKHFISSCNKIINIHASLLPSYRGAAPVAHAILDDKRITGVTIISIEPKIDSGEILDSDYLFINENDTTGILEDRLSYLGSNITRNFVKKLINKASINGILQDVRFVTKAPRIAKEFGLINWDQEARQILLHVRAMQPWPTAYTFVHQENKEPTRVAVIKCSVTNEMATIKSGEVLIRDKRILVASKNYFIEIEIIHPSGKKPMTSEEYLRGIKNKILKVQ